MSFNIFSKSKKNKFSRRLSVSSSLGVDSHVYQDHGSQQDSQASSHLAFVGDKESFQPCLESLTNTPENCDIIKLILKDKMGLNLLNNRAIYNLYNLPLFTDNGNEQDSQVEINDSHSCDQFSGRFSKLVLSKLNSNTADKSHSLSRSNLLRPTKSNQADYSSKHHYTESKKSEKSHSRRGSIFGLLKLKSRQDNQPVEDETLPTLSSPASHIPNSSLAIASDSQFDVHTKTGDSHIVYENNHKALQSVIQDDLSTIKISIMNSNDKIFLPTVTSASGRRGRVNRSLNSNINGIGNSLDEELESYENRSHRRTHPEPVQEDEENANDDVDDNEDEAIFDENATGNNPILHTFAMVVSIPKESDYSPNNDGLAPVLQPLDSTLEPLDSASQALDSRSVSSLLSSDVESYVNPVSNDVNSYSVSPSFVRSNMTKTNVDLSHILVSFTAVCKIFWKELAQAYSSAPPRIDSEEEFLVGNSSCQLDLMKDFNYFIPADSDINPEVLKHNFSHLSDSTGFLSDNSLDYLNPLLKTSTHSSKAPHKRKIVFGSNESQPLQKFHLKSINKIKNDPYYNKNSLLEEQFSIGLNEPKGLYDYPPGDYIFVLPMIFDGSFPETIRAPHAALNYKFNLCLKRFEHQLGNSSIGNGMQRRHSISKSLKKLTPSLSRNDAETDIEELVDEDNSVDLERKDINTATMTKNVDKNLANESIYTKQQMGLVEKLISKSFRLPLIRGPPDFSSALNKPIYVNRIWNDSLLYELSFPNKFVRINSEIPMNIKLLPLCKDIYIKKVKINILERVSYVSKNLEVEFDEGKKNIKDHNVVEKVVPLSELRTKSEGGYAVREDVLKLYDNALKDVDEKGSEFEKFRNKLMLRNDEEEHRNTNMLAFCYKNAADEKFGKKTSIRKPRKEILVDRSLLIQTPLFFKGIQSHHYNYHNSSKSVDEDNNRLHGHKIKPKTPRPKFVANNDNQLPDDYRYVNKTEKELWKEIKSSKTKVKYGDSFLEVSRYVPRLLNESTFDFRSRHQLIPDLYPDSNCFNYISVSHRLQVCFRISKKEAERNAVGDEVSNKLHHYEVIIDAPIILVSDLCDDENVVLPPYLEEPLNNDLNITSAEADRQATERLNREFDTEHLPTFEEATSPLLSTVPDTVDDISAYPLDQPGTGDHHYKNNHFEENELNSMVLLSPVSTNYSMDLLSPSSPRLMPLLRYNSGGNNIDDIVGQPFNINEVLSSDTTGSNAEGALQQKLNFDKTLPPTYDEIISANVNNTGGE